MLRKGRKPLIAPAVFALALLLAPLGSAQGQPPGSRTERGDPASLWTGLLDWLGSGFRAVAAIWEPGATHPGPFDPDGRTDGAETHGDHGSQIDPWG